jgi:hypothetical protein
MVAQLSKMVDGVADGRAVVGPDTAEPGRELGRPGNHDRQAEEGGKSWPRIARHHVDQNGSVDPSRSGPAAIDRQLLVAVAHCLQQQAIASLAQCRIDAGDEFHEPGRLPEGGGSPDR